MFPYIGGKSHHVKWIDNLFPPISKYVEVFGGAGWVMMKSPKVSLAQERVYNDYNPLLANVFHCLRTDPEGILSLMERIQQSDIVLYRTYQRELFSPDIHVHMGDMGLAVKYLYLQTQLFAGTPLSLTSVPYFTEIKSNGKYPSKWETLKRKLHKPEIRDRLRTISSVESMDCEELIAKHDGKNTFFYLDPPYHGKEFYYSKDFPKEKHQSLSVVLSGIQGKFALSYYPFQDLETFYPPDRYRYHRQDVYRSAATRAGNEMDYGKRARGQEILVMNY